MKVPQDRLGQEEPYYPHNAAQNLRAANAPQNDVHYETPHNAEINNPHSPLEAKRRVQPTLANSAPETSSEYPDEFYHDSAPPYAHGDTHNADGNFYDVDAHADPYNQPPQPLEQGAAQHTAPEEPQKINQQGPYQAVVVFLLLLMALVILGIVYQLFFRPTPDYLPITGQVVEQNYSENDIDSNTLPSDNSNLEQNETQVLPPAQEPLETTPSLSSPLSSVTPSGDVLPQPKPSSENPQIPLVPKAPPAPANYTTQQQAQSKIGGIGYWIQVGAFSSFANANSIKQELGRHHIESVIQQSAGTRKFYRVRVGLYTSEEEAKRILRQLHNIGNPFSASIIIKIKI